MEILDLLLLVAVGGMTVRATIGQHFHHDKTGMGGIYGYSYNGGYRGLNVALGFGDGGISATGGVYGGGYGGGAATGGYSAGAAAGGGGHSSGGGYGTAGYGNRYAYESGYGQQWRRRYGYRDRSVHRRFPSYDYDYSGAYQFRRGRRFNNYKNDYYDY